MAYVWPNVKSKKALKDLLKAGRPVEVEPVGLSNVPVNGRVSLCGPHYPEPHKWYAEGTMENGRLVKIH